jgi:hypothetical protein
VTTRLRIALVLLALPLLSTAWNGAAFAETILVPGTVPSFNQNYTDGPGAWGDCRLGTSGCPDQISTTGCLVTAFSSVLAYYQIEVSVSASESCTGRSRTGMDPGILNDWLRARAGFGQCAQDPVGSCCLAWDRLPGDLELTFYENRSDVGLNPVSAVVIDHALRGGNLVVAGVHWGSFCRSGSSQTEDCHWIVLTGKIGETYAIVDPINLDPTDSKGVRTTLDEGTRGSYIIDRYVVVQPGEPTSDEATPDPNAASEPASDEEASPSAAGAAIVVVALLAAIAVLVAVVSSGSP